MDTAISREGVSIYLNQTETTPIVPASIWLYFDHYVIAMNGQEFVTAAHQPHHEILGKKMRGGAHVCHLER